jgi:hypothetical protein
MNPADPDHPRQLSLSHHGAERIHDDDAGAGRLDLLDDLGQDGVQIVVEHDLAEVDEANRAVQLVRVEELELLLVAQHLDGRLAQHGEVERGALERGVGEHDLVRQRGLAAARSARDDVEGKFRQATA